MSSLRRGRVALKILLVGALLAATALVIGRLVLQSAAAAPVGDVRPLAAFIGDGYTEGAGATSTSARWTTLVAHARGWREVNFGRAFTGYASSSKQKVCGYALCPEYSGWVDQVAALDPSIVVVEGGQGDWLAWQTDASSTTSKIDDLYTTLRQRLPDARIVVVGPLQPPGASHAATVDEIAGGVKKVAAGDDLTYVDVLHPNVLSSGSEIAADRFNANDAGQRAIAERVLQALS